MINGRETIVLFKILYTCLSLFWQLPMSGQTRLLLPFFFVSHMKVKVKVAQWCLTLCNPMDCTVHGILQARILEWVAFPFSKGSSQPRDQTQVSHITVWFFTSWATREALRISKKIIFNVTFSKVVLLFCIGQWAPLQTVSFNRSPSFFEHFLLSGTRCSKLILYFLYPSPRIILSPKNLHSF